MRISEDSDNNNNGTVQGKVSLTVIGGSQKGTIFSKQQVEVRTEDTPYTVLSRNLGSQVETRGSGDRLYVSGIAGLREFDHGPESGWVYSVNGDYPSLGANVKTLNTGDQLVWEYKLKADPSKGPGGSPSSNQTNPSVEAAIKSVKIPANNQIALKDIQGAVIAVIQSDTKMTPQQVKQIKESLQQNIIQLSESVQPTDSKVLSDSQEEVRLQVPAGAVTTQTELTIQKQQANQPEVVSAIYSFGPKGMKFNQPVTISIKIPLEIDDLSQLALVWLNEKTGEWVPIPAVVDPSTGIVTGKLIISPILR